MKILKKDMTQDILKEYMNYNEITGVLTWKKKYCNKVVVGNRIGSVATTHKHRVVHFMGSLYAEHRLIWLWYYGNYPKHHIDHIDHNEQNNAINNLRDVTQKENNINNSKRRDNTSGITGIWINKNNKYKKYMAELHYDRKKVFCKSFYSLEEAKKALEVERDKYGFHNNHGINKPPL